MSGPRIGLALGGGIARGWSHIGVLRRLDEIGLVPDVICGTSMGALVGGFYLANEMERLAAVAGTLTRIRMLRLLDIAFGDSGMIGGKRLFKELERVIGNLTIEELDSPFAAVAAELATGHETWLTHGCLLDAIRASVSLPGIFPPVKMHGRWLVDGALVNPVPVSVCRALGARMVIAVNLTGDTMGSVPTPAPKNGGNGGPKPEEMRNNLMPAMRQYLGAEMSEPNFFNTMAASFNILLDRVTRSRLAGDPPDMSIIPRVGHIGLLDFHRADEAMEEGAKAVDRIVPELREVLRTFGAGPRDTTTVGAAEFG
jgi:NTE family protein